jgi:hypothetical protein
MRPGTVRTCVRMRAKKRERARARALRAEGLSLKVIARRLGVSVSSVSVWVRDVPMPSPPVPPPEPPRALSGEKRYCSRCAQVRPIEDFNRYRGKRQWWCRDCFRAYFRRRGDLHRKQVEASKRKRIDQARGVVRAYLEARRCCDCGEDNPVVLEFDHIRDKIRDVSRLVYDGRLTLLAAEMAKCEVVCRNCHRRRTAARAGWHCANPEGEFPATYTQHIIRNVTFVYGVLKSGCVDCGEADLRVLDFDHIGEKRGQVGTLARSGASIERLRQEIAQCEIRCANCHKRRTVLRRALGRRADSIELPP